MSIRDAFSNPTKNTVAGYGTAIRDFRRTRAATDPFYNQGIGYATKAGGTLADLYGLNGTEQQQIAQDNFMTSPGYDARLAAGTRAIDQSAAANGMLKSGSTLKGLQQFAQDLYSQEFNQYLGGLSGLYQGGYAGAQGLTQNSANAGNLAISRGQAIDAGNAAQFGNALGALGTGLSFLTGGGMPSLSGLGGNGRIRMN